MLKKYSCRSKFIIVLGIVSSLISCGGGDDQGIPPRTELPPDIPVETTVSGVVMLGPVANADINIYELKINDSLTSRVISSTQLPITAERTNNRGEFNLSIELKGGDTAVLVCATGGSYIEPASAPLTVEKTFSSSDKLCAVTVLKRGVDQIVNVTYFTHLAYGYASSRILDGMPLLDASNTRLDGTEEIIPGRITSSNKIVSDWLQMKTGTANNQAVIHVKPQEISDSTVASGSLTNELKYGFANAAISDLAEWMRLSSASTQNKTSFDNVSSILLAQQVFLDISDGRLDGLGDETRLFLSDSALSEKILRYNFALKIFTVAGNNEINKSGLTISGVNDFVQAVNDNGLLFSNSAKQDINNLTPLFTTIYPDSNGILEGDATIRVDVTDLSNIASIDMTIDTVPAGGNTSLPTNLVATNPAKPEWQLTTGSGSSSSALNIPDGLYEIHFNATNTKGDQSTHTLSNIRISNTGISTVIINPPKVPNDADPLLPRNPINSLAGFRAVINDVFFPSAGTGVRSSVKFSIVESTAPFTSIVNLPLDTTQTTPLDFTEISPISRQYFAVDINTANTTSVILDGKYKLQVDATSEKDVIPLLAAIPVTVDFELDTQDPISDFITPDLTVFTADATIDMDISDPMKNNYASGINTKILSHDGVNQAVGVPFTGSQAIFTLDTQGWHELTLQASDYAGNTVATPAKIHVAYDTIAPTVVIEQSTIASSWWNTLDIVTNVGDGESGIKEIVTGFDNTDPATLDTTGTVVDLSTKPKPPAIFDLHTETVSINAASLTALGLSDGVHSYRVRVSDYAAPAATHTKDDVLSNFGIDTTPPTITFTGSSIDPAIWTDVTTSTNIVINKVTKTATINWTIDATIEEPGYLPDTSVGILDTTATSSGISELFVDTLTTPTINPLKNIVQKLVPLTIINLPQHEVTSTATMEAVWDVIAECPKASEGRTMQVTGTQCQEVKDGKTTNIATNYIWTQKLTSPTYSATSDTSNFTDLALPANFLISKTLTEIKATDKSLPTGNSIIKFSCLNFRVKNVTPDVLLDVTGAPVAARLPAAIVADSGVTIIEPNIKLSPNTEPPAQFQCTEKTADPNWPVALTPLLQGSKTVPLLNVNTVTCSIRGTGSAVSSTLTPAAAAQVYIIESQLIIPDQTITPAACL